MCIEKLGIDIFDTYNTQMKKQKQGSKEANNEDGSGKDKFTGLIFMCNSQTKKECLRYKCLGCHQPKRSL